MTVAAQKASTNIYTDKVSSNGASYSLSLRGAFILSFSFDAPLCSPRFIRFVETDKAESLRRRRAFNSAGSSFLSKTANFSVQSGSTNADPSLIYRCFNPSESCPNSRGPAYIPPSYPPRDKSRRLRPLRMRAGENSNSIADR